MSLHLTNNVSFTCWLVGAGAVRSPVLCTGSPVLHVHSRVLYASSRVLYVSFPIIHIKHDTVQMLRFAWVCWYDTRLSLPFFRTLGGLLTTSRCKEQKYYFLARYTQLCTFSQNTLQI